MSEDLPDAIDPDLWFWSERCGGRDYLEPTYWHTRPGHLAAYCPHDAERHGYRITRPELPDDLPVATRYFVLGFLSGNVPERPWGDDPAEPTLVEWERAAQRFLELGWWQVDADLEDPWRRVEAAMHEDAAVLRAIGAAIEGQVGAVEVRIPRTLADAAVAAAETWAYSVAAADAHLVRERAAALQALGHAVAQHGEADGDEVVVALDVEVLGQTITASLERW